MCCVTLLPEEFPAPEEGYRVFELPSDNGVPLIEAQGEVPMTSYPLGVVGVHDGLGCWPYGDWLIELAIPPRDIVSNHCHFARANIYAIMTQATSAENPSIWSFSRSRTS